jgi:hypothetical protein
VECRVQEGNFTFTIDDSRCTGTKPTARARSLHERGCYTWNPGAWSAYDSQCSTSARRTRNIGCNDAASRPVDVELCENHATETRPDATDSSAVGTACNISWQRGSAVTAMSTCNGNTSVSFQTTCIRDGAAVPNSTCTDGINGVGLGAPPAINPNENGYFRNVYYENRACTTKLAYNPSPLRSISASGTHEEYLTSSGVLLGSTASKGSVAEQHKVVAEWCAMRANDLGHYNALFCVFTKMGTATDGRIAYAFTLKTAPSGPPSGYYLHARVTFSGVTLKEEPNWQSSGQAMTGSPTTNVPTLAGNTACGSTIPLNNTSYRGTLTCNK